MITSYTDVSYDLAKLLTLRYSSSFGLATRFFSPALRQHIYAIYGMVRVADEIVDTYRGHNKSELLNSFEREVRECIELGYSANPIINAYGMTARTFDIGTELTNAFFDSMRTDLTRTQFTQKQYEDYIYGSAEVIGLMCLKVFCQGDQAQYNALCSGARKLGSAYQKVNFLRDFGADYNDRGRIYFPGVTMNNWNDLKKEEIAVDIYHEFEASRDAIARLPRSARTAVYISYLYYRALLKRLRAMSARQVLIERARVPFLIKVALIMIAPLARQVR